MKKSSLNTLRASYKKCLIVILTFAFMPFSVFAAGPDCTGKDRWPTSMAFAYLKNAGLTDNERLDFSKTKTIRLASEKIGKNLYRQVHHIIFKEKSGKKIEVITINEASNSECSMGGLEAFIVSSHLGDTKRW